MDSEPNPMALNEITGKGHFLLWKLRQCSVRLQLLVFATS